MRRFYLQRNEDATGMSGTGIVAMGVEFSSGWCALMWKSEIASLTTYTSISSVEKLHSHSGQHDTKIVWIDPKNEEIEDKAKEVRAKELKELTAEIENQDPDSSDEKSKRPKPKAKR